MDVEADAGHRQQGRHQAEVRGAEPQPARRSAPACRSSTASSASCRSRPSNFLGRGETRRRLAAEGLAGAAVPGLVQRAVSVRPADHGRRRRLHAPVHLPVAVHAGDDRQQLGLRLAARRLHAAVHGLQLRAGQRLRHQPGVSEPAALVAARFCATRCCSTRAAGAWSARSRRAWSSTPSTSRSSRPTGKRLHGSASTSPASAATRNYYQTRARRHLVQPVHAAACRSACAPKRSTSGRTAARPTLPIFEKIFLGGEYSIRGFDIRTHRPARSDHRRRDRRQQDAAVQRRVLHQRRGPVRLLAFYDAGQVRDIGQTLRVVGGRHASWCRRRRRS